jgi:hypothetical protein
VSTDEQPDGAWIFVSHSHKDLEKVRQVRDALEKMGHNPLLFFLKCLGDDDEVDDLVRREIEARRFFLLCDSPNAGTSRWVQAEREIIKGLQGKVDVAVDLSADWESQLGRIMELARRATVYLAYARKDAAPFAEVIAAELRRHDYHVDRPIEHITEVGDFRLVLEQAIDEALQTGFVLALLSPEALRSEWVSWEIRYALSRRADEGIESWVVPIVIGDPKTVWSMMRDLPKWDDLRDLQPLVIRDPTDVSRDIDHLLTDLRRPRSQ